MRETAEKQVSTDALSETALLSAAECGRMCGISRRTWFRLASSAKTPACVRVGASPRWVRRTLEHWIALGCPSRKEFEARREAEDAR